MGSDPGSSLSARAFYILSAGRGVAWLRRYSSYFAARRRNHRSGGPDRAVGRDAIRRSECVYKSADPNRRANDYPVLDVPGAAVDGKRCH